MDIAVLGMGRMGSALASRLLQGGHRVTVWNRSEGKAGEVVSAGALEAQSIADAVREADVVITMLANDDAVRTVALGDLRSSIGDPTVYVNCSTVSLALSSELAEAFPDRFLAMPVLKNRFESVLTGPQDGWFTAVLGAKDATMAINVARGANVELQPEVRQYSASHAGVAACAAIGSLRWASRTGLPALIWTITRGVSV